MRFCNGSEVFTAIKPNSRIAFLKYGSLLCRPAEYAELSSFLDSFERVEVCQGRWDSQPENEYGTTLGLCSHSDCDSQNDIAFMCDLYLPCHAVWSAISNSDKFNPQMVQCQKVWQNHMNDESDGKNLLFKALRSCCLRECFTLLAYYVGDHQCCPVI